MRKLIIANIESLEGCAGAEHYYCKYKEITSVELIYKYITEYDNLLLYGGEDLWYNPTKEYAHELALKDNNMLEGEHTNDDMESIMHYGTGRFKFMHDIKKTLEEKFPDTEIIITKDNSIKKFWESYMHEQYRIEFFTLPKQRQEEIYRFIMGDEKADYYMNWTDSARFDKMFITVYVEHKAHTFAGLINDSYEK